MIITLSIDDQFAQSATKVAKKLGKNLNQVVLDYVEQLADGAQRDQQWEQFERSCLTSGGKRKGWKFNRDEANQR